jgi:transposase
VRRRRSGARCWLDQELVSLTGVTHYRPAAAVSPHQTGTTGPYELDEHVMAVVTAPAGAVVAGAAAPAHARGYRELLRVAEQHAPGRRAWAIEGTGSDGAGLGRYLHTRGESVLEVGRIAPGDRRLRGKDDALDAARTARAALASDTLALPRTGARREALRLLLVARRSAVDVRREGLTQLRAVIVTAPELLRQELCRLPEGKLLDRYSRFRRTSSAGADELATRIGLRSLARRGRTATVEADELEREILAHVRALAPTLLDEPGVGPIVAAQLIVAWSHPGRLRSEACFARLAGVAPIPASSGQTTRHRLSRGGDRQLNRALHTIVLHRRQHDPATRDYIARRIAEGKSRRDATRLRRVSEALGTSAERERGGDGGCDKSERYPSNPDDSRPREDGHTLGGSVFHVRRL